MSQGDDLPGPIPLSAIKSPEGRQQLVEVDVIIGVDTNLGLQTLFFGRELLEDIILAQESRHVRIIVIDLDFGSDEPDWLSSTIREVRGTSSYRPADLFPEVIIDDDSFPSDLLKPVRQAIDEIRQNHRTILPAVQRIFYLHMQAAGYREAEEILREAARQAGDREAYIVTLLTLGTEVYQRLAPDLIQPFRLIDIKPSREDDRKIHVRCRSLLMQMTPSGPAYHSRRMPKWKFNGDGRDRVVAFSNHALVRVCERTVYGWRTFVGHGDAFALLDNCVYFEDCTPDFGRPCFLIFDSCMPGFWSWVYAEHILGNPDPAQQYYYRVGYCPVDFYGEFAKAKTLLVPGMRGTPERHLIESSGFPIDEIRRMEEQVEKQLSMKALVDASDISLIKWFHDNGVPQVIQSDRQVFVYD